jgi:hypothetical protein
MSFDPRELRAIKHYAQEHGDLQLSLCVPPTVHFIERKTGNTVKVDIKLLLQIYDRDRKEAAKERARMKRQQKKMLVSR